MYSTGLNFHAATMPKSTQDIGGQDDATGYELNLQYG